MDVHGDLMGLNGDFNGVWLDSKGGWMGFDGISWFDGGFNCDSPGTLDWLAISLNFSESFLVMDKDLFRF